MTDNLRPIKAISIAGVTPATVSDLPELKWLPLDCLVINDEYQRALSERSVSAIRKIVANFDWAKLKALSVIDVGDGKFEVIDGQHTAIAAASHKQIAELPCLVSGARTVEKRAEAFVGLNRDRVQMTDMQVFHAELKAGDEIAVEIQQGVDSAGGRVLKNPTSTYKVGDLMCIGALRQLAKKGGPAWVKRAVSLGIQGKLAPIKSPVLRGLVRLIWEGEHAGKLTDQQIVDVFRLYGQEKLIDRAKAYRSDNGGTPADCFAEVIVRLS
ncbi:hypothetical protein KUV46_15825 [Thalassovita mediterranea]|nr:hypothetical protein KUV46_15825 [Thalassovita mediterranea]